MSATLAHAISVRDGLAFESRARNRVNEEHFAGIPSLCKAMPV
jgi:hypothetical protein